MFGPAAVLGIVIGNRLHSTIPTAGLLKIVYGLLVFSGLSLVARNALFA
jgi:uncharacterized membrane protein YfcA